MISYEIILGLSLVGIFILTGSLSLRDIMLAQQGTIEHRPAWTSATGM